MTAVQPSVAGSRAPHPLDPLTPEEITAARDIVAAAGRVTASTRFPQVLPIEPDKTEWAAHPDGDGIERRILCTLLDTATGRAFESVVSLPQQREVSYTELDTATYPYGQPPYLFEEYEQTEAIVKSSPRWQAAMARRGLADDIDLAFCTPLAPGYSGREDEAGRRTIRSLTFLRNDESDNPWAHPVEGLMVHVDLTAGEVFDVEDDGDTAVPRAHGRYDPAAVGPPRTSLRPIEITQPEGTSFDVDGHAVTWESWRFRVGFNAREGLVLHQVALHDGDADRLVLHRASIPEMVVPYGDTASTRSWIAYFDAGEYLLGKNANSLRLGCDCLGDIYYFDAVVADDQGRPLTIPQAVCMHEEDYGVLWKHTALDGSAEVRRSRRLVVSYFSTVGNYDYGFYWYFYLDGTIQVEVKATGIVFAGAGAPGESRPYAPEIAPGIFTPVHQHLFCARLDVAVDGERNSVHELDLAGVPTGDENPLGNAFTQVSSPLRNEQDAARMADPAKGRCWEVRSSTRTNRVGKPTAYRLMPQASAALMAQPDSTLAQRAAFATKHLWVTAYDPAERFPAGDYPNAHAGGAGLPAWTGANRSLEDTDLVLWHVFGPTHIPRPEDWPVMPVDYSGFSLRPHGFWDQNPALDLPTGGHCDHGEHSDPTPGGDPDGTNGRS